MELNEALKSYANKKSLEIDLVGKKLMSKGFTFEKNSPHQKAGVDALMSMFVGAQPQQSGDPCIVRLRANPVL